MDKFIETLTETVLPDCFELSCTQVSFETDEDFLQAVEDPVLFEALGFSITGRECSGVYVDRYESGFLGAYALALWFMGFDQDNWFSFEDIHRQTKDMLNSRIKLKERLELRLLKGEFPPMMLDQPVLIDFREKTVSFLSGKLNN